MDEQTNQAPALAAPAPATEPGPAPFDIGPTLEPFQPRPDPADTAARAETEPLATFTHDRARALVDGYAHALATNSPRTVAELAEIKALLDVE